MHDQLVPLVRQIFLNVELPNDLEKAKLLIAGCGFHFSITLSIYALSQITELPCYRYNL